MAQQPGVLEGIRVVEVGTFIFGPAAATVMSDFGADIIKVEPPGIGDPYRYLHTIRHIDSGRLHCAYSCRHLQLLATWLESFEEN